MALPLKGTWKDTPKSLQPPQYNFEVINGVVNKNIGSWTNEPGASQYSASYNAMGYSIIGVSNAKYGDKIVMSVASDGLSKIGIIKKDGTYVEKLSAALGFNLDYPIDIESYYDYKGDLIVAFTDNLNTPKLINLDAVKTPFNIGDIQLYSYFTQPQVVSDVLESGGSLKTGAYFPFFAYKDDDVSTPYTSVENPIFITNSTFGVPFDKYKGAPANTPSSKAISLSLKGIDRNYTKIVVGLISKIDGVLTAKIYKEVNISSDIATITITGSETSSLITISEVLTSSSVYEKIKHFTQVHGVLYGAGTTEKQPLNIQKYINLIKLTYTSDLIEPSELASSFKVNLQNNIHKSFCHQEVYAFYAKVKIKGQGMSQAFPIPGREPEGNEDKFYAVINPGGNGVETSINSAAKLFQIEDTSGINGKMGYWQNEDEYYPNTDDFAPVNGSRDLRGKNVRHHRFPSIKKCKETLYANYDMYAVKKLDILGIKVELPTFPTDILAQIEGFEIFYAKRDVNNSTVNGQSLTMIGAYRGDDLSDKKIYYTGSTWEIQTSKTANQFLLKKNRIRFNSFDLMLDKPSINPSYLYAQIRMKTNVKNHLIKNENNVISYQIDYQSGETVVEPIPANDKIKKLTGFQYVPANANAGDYMNIIGEETAVGTVEGDGYAIPTAGMIMTSLATQGANIDQVSDETTYLVNLMAYKTSIYSSYEQQTLVSTGKFIKVGDTDLNVWGGDTNIGKYGFIVFAPNSIEAVRNPSAIGDEYMPWNNIGAAIKNVRAFITESNNNVTLRHSVDGDEYTKFYPNETFDGSSTWFRGFPRTSNPNKIAYNKDYSSLNDLNASVIYSSTKKFIAVDPYKIIRSKIPNTEERQSSWKVFLANDYYIIPRDKGYITNIQGVGNDLIINCEAAVMKTQGSEELATDTFKVVLGTGNIFERPPIELIFEKDGYAGCQHKHSCLLTRHGYFFVDEDKKKIFMVRDTVKDVTDGLVNFFYDNLKTTGDNPYRGKGYTVAWDEYFNRIVLSSKEANFTRSYTPELESWTSKHDYRPDVLIGDRNSFFAFSSGKIFKHNDLTKRGQYYDDTIYPFGIVIIHREDNKQIAVSNIGWKTQVTINQSLYKDITFDSITAWNSYQATQNIKIIPHDSSKGITYNYRETNARRVRNEWNFNKIKDVLNVSDTKFVDDIDIIQSTLNINKAFNLKKMLTDDYVAIKLLFSNQKIGTLQAEIQLLDFDVNSNTITR